MCVCVCVCVCVTCLEVDGGLVDEVAGGQEEAADDLEHVERLARARRHGALADERGGHLVRDGDGHRAAGQQLAPELALPLLDRVRAVQAVRAEHLAHLLLHLWVYTASSNSGILACMHITVLVQ